MAENQSKKQDKQHQIPMMVTDEVIRDFGFKPEDVTWHRIGNRKCRVVMAISTSASSSSSCLSLVVSVFSCIRSTSVSERLSCPSVSERTEQGFFSGEKFCRPCASHF